MKVKGINQICSPLKISQPINAELSVCDEMTKACTVDFMKARDSLVVRCSERKKSRR